MASTLPSPSLEEDEDKKSLEYLPQDGAVAAESSSRVKKLFGAADTPPPRTLKSRHLTLISIGGTIGTVRLARNLPSARKRELIFSLFAARESSSVSARVSQRPGQVVLSCPISSSVSSIRLSLMSYSY